MVFLSTTMLAMSAARKARRFFSLLLTAFILFAAGAWLWSMPVVRAFPETLRLSRMPVPPALPVPVEGVRADRITDTWGAARTSGRSHEGVDIFAERGTLVSSATRGVVARIDEQGLGGKQVWVIGPGGERHYYAHLDDWAPGLHAWQRVQAGDPLGFVGTTGNARGTPPHLHYGIYAAGGALNPHPRLAEPPDNPAFTPPR